MRITSGNRESGSRLVRGFRRLRALRGLPRWAGLLFAVVSVGASGVVRQQLSGPLYGYPFLLFFPAIILTSLLFDHGAGFVAAGLSVLLSLWFIPDARSSVLPLVLFALIAFTCAASIELLQVAVAETVEREERLVRARASGETRETRLSETIHRVRNDLGALSSLLTLQSRRRPEASDVLAAAANQIRVLGRLHSRFSEADRLAVVCSDDFLHELARDLEITHFAEGSIRLVVEADRVELPLDTATTLGLIVNELITNAAKYAFPEGRGAIEVSFRREGDRDTLTVADDGVGLTDKIQGTGLGTDLLHRLARQLDGEFKRERRANGPGTVGTVILPVKPIAPE